MWEDIWFSMSDGDISQYDALKAKPEGEFYNIIDLHEKKVERLKSKK